MTTPLEASDPQLFGIIERELERQNTTIQLIASENFTSRAVIEAQGSVLTNKYSEGYPHKRYYGGNQVVDEAEDLARDRACALFGAEHANVQPHSGANANMAVFLAVLQPGDKVMGMRLDQGGHLTHGSPVNFSGRLYDFASYGVHETTEQLDYDEIARVARAERPKLIIAGATAYPRTIDFERFRAIADEVGAILMVDAAHIAGLIAGGAHPSPLPHADIVTFTTHKTLRGPRAGAILCREQYAAAIDKAVFPGLQGGPHNHTTAGIAVAFKEAATGEFRAYAARIVENAKVLAAALQREGFRVISGGTQNHLVVVDATSMGVTGRQLAKAMDAAGMVCNFNRIPFDTQPAMHPSGVRLGTPATTSRGFGPEQMEQIAAWMAQVARLRADEGQDLEARKQVYRQIAAQVKAVCDRFPAPGLLYGPEGKPV